MATACDFSLLRMRRLDSFHNVASSSGRKGSNSAVPSREGKYVNVDLRLLCRKTGSAAVQRGLSQSRAVNLSSHTGLAGGGHISSGLASPLHKTELSSFCRKGRETAPSKRKSRHAHGVRASGLESFNVAETLEGIRQGSTALAAQLGHLQGAGLALLSQSASSAMQGAEAVGSQIASSPSLLKLGHSASAAVQTAGHLSTAVGSRVGHLAADVSSNPSLLATGAQHAASETISGLSSAAGASAAALYSQPGALPSVAALSGAVMGTALGNVLSALNAPDDAGGQAFGTTSGSISSSSKGARGRGRGRGGSVGNEQQEEGGGGGKGGQ
eukprot:jgi/Mesen1/10391/ME000081S09786